MARMVVYGFDALLAGLEDMAENTPKLRDDILEAEANVIEPAIRQSIADNHLVRSGRLLGSISRKKLVSRGGLYGARHDHAVPVIRIGPTGEHHRYLPKSGGKSGIVTAGYIGYLYEYGLPRRGIAARKPIEKAIAKSKNKAYDAADAVYYKYMKKHKL